MYVDIFKSIEKKSSAKLYQIFKFFILKKKTFKQTIKQILINSYAPTKILINYFFAASYDT